LQQGIGLIGKLINGQYIGSGMGLYLVDKNIICFRWMPSSYSADVDKALAKDSDWIAPLLWRSEFRNALAGLMLAETY